MYPFGSRACDIFCKQSNLLAPHAPTARQQSLTAPGTVIGTMSYMSSEQMSGENVDERSELFALGVMVVEALTGERPSKVILWLSC
jgi:serine/threonine protein kinase